MRCFITGIAGFAGRHLARRLVDDGHEVAGLAQKREAAEAAGLPAEARVAVGDVRETETLNRLVADHRPDVVYHLAAVSAVREAASDPDAAFSVNFHGTWSVCRAVRYAGIDPEIFVVTSAAVYGAQDGPIPETAPLRPADAYALSKAAADLLARQQHSEHGLRTIRLRPFNHLGPGQSPAFVASDWAWQIARAEAGAGPARIAVGNLRSVRDFLPIDDVIEAYVRAPGRLRPGEAYNIASGRGLEVREILDLLLGMARIDIEVEERPDRHRKGEVTSLVGDATRLRQEASWEPAGSLRDALEALLGEWRGRETPSG